MSMLRTEAVAIRQLLGQIHGKAAHTVPEHPTITEDWCVRGSSSHALTNPHGDTDTEDLQRKAQLDDSELATIRTAIAQAVKIATSAFNIVKQRYPFDDIYFPVAEETYYAALIIFLDMYLPARFQADNERMQRELEAKKASAS
ncbi:MAG TPA: hypothetical protein VJT81_01785 [Burkholderiales bacterium]|nr:hypothetical protein [Burkholderiales bacterium]